MNEPLVYKTDTIFGGACIELHEIAEDKNKVRLYVYSPIFSKHFDLDKRTVTDEVGKIAAWLSK